MKYLHDAESTSVSLLEITAVQAKGGHKNFSNIKNNICNNSSRRSYDEKFSNFFNFPFYSWLAFI